jgi:hypothetical protein
VTVVHTARHARTDLFPVTKSAIALLGPICGYHGAKQYARPHVLTYVIFCFVNLTWRTAVFLVATSVPSQVLVRVSHPPHTASPIAHTPTDVSFISISGVPHDFSGGVHHALIRDVLPDPKILLGRRPARAASHGTRAREGGLLVKRFGQRTFVSGTFDTFGT